MIEMTPLRVGAIATIAWIGLWTLVFDQWFFWSPLGLLTVFGLPVAAWLAWWKLFRVEGQQIDPDELATLGKEGAARLSKLGQRWLRRR